MTTKDVHTEHCCLRHGCKYGKDDCTVAQQIAPQSFPCEQCDFDAEMAAEERELIRDLLILLNGSVCPGNGKRANELIARGNELLGEEVGKPRRIAGT